MKPEILQLDEARAMLDQLFAELAKGKSFIVMDGDKVISYMEGFAKSAAPKRQFGQLAGQKFWIADDFDAPLKDIEDAIYGEKE